MAVPVIHMLLVPSITKWGSRDGLECTDGGLRRSLHAKVGKSRLNQCNSDAFRLVLVS